MISCWEYGRPNHSNVTVAVLAIIVRVIAIMLVIVIVVIIVAMLIASTAARRNCSAKQTLRVQVPNNHVVPPNVRYYYPNPKYPMKP